MQYTRQEHVLWALGIGEGTESVNAVSDDEDQLSAGWPMLELTKSYKSVVSPTTLRQHSDADLERLRTPVTVFEIEVNPDIDPTYGTYDLGDWARFRIEDLFLDPAFDKFARITEIHVTVDDSTGLETISLTLGGNEVSTEE